MIFDSNDDSDEYWLRYPRKQVLRMFPLVDSGQLLSYGHVTRLLYTNGIMIGVYDVCVFVLVKHFYIEIQSSLRTKYE